MLKTIFFIIFSILFFYGCGANEPTIDRSIALKKPIVKRVNIIKVKNIYVAPNSVNSEYLKDLKTFPQNPKFYTKHIPKLTLSEQQKLYKRFLKNYFHPWDINRVSLSKKDAQWGNAYADSTVYRENYRKIPSQWFKQMINLSNMEKYNSVKQKAITITNSNIKVFPTIKPIFKNYTQAGEGFPFDYNQNTSIKINSPLFISHYSKDKAWAYVESSFSFGWIKTSDIALVDKNIINIFKNAKSYNIAITDHFPIYKKGIFKEYIALGTLFPVYKNHLVTVIKDNNLKGYISLIQKNKNTEKFPIIFNRHNINKIISQLINKPYGWGGLYQNRDCSLLTQDTLAPFGFSLQRNSYGQAQDGHFISLKNKTNQEKKDIIKSKAIPFLSLIYIKGHIALYLGIYKNEPVIFHSFWGVKTIKNNISNRYIVGKSIISSLEPGKEIKTYNKEQTILHKIKGIVILK